MSARLRLTVVILLAALAGQCIFSMRTKAPTSDELSHHVASGYSHLVMRDFRMNPAMPPLPRLLSAIPLYFLGEKMPSDHISWKEGNSPVFAQEFFYHYNKNADQIIFWARFPIVLVSLLFALLVFAWARELFGDAGGIMALILYVFCPDVVAHSSLATSDLCVAFFFTLTFYLFWKYLKAPSRKLIVLTGLAAGGAFLSKFSAVLLFPILLIAALAARRGASVTPRKIAGFLLVCFATVWAGYFFEVKPLLKNTPDPAKKIAFIQKIGGDGLVAIAEKTPLPLSTFASAISGMVFTRAKGTNAYLMGHWSQTGWWYYYFVAFAIKNTIPFLILIFAAFILLPKLKLDRTTLSIVIVPIAFFFIATMPDRAQAGIRYFLPVYPLFFLLAAGAAAHLSAKRGAAKTAVIALLS
jgi:4-amino-4-deoxy-L-arabinose transferase-like glycosyltransferase